MSPFDLVLESARARGFNVVVRNGPEARLQCGNPEHPDHHPSVSLREGDDGRALIYCHSRQCSAERILSGYGLGLKDLFPPDRHQSGYRGRGAR